LRLPPSRTPISVFVWVLLVPLVSHLLLGRRAGFVTSVLYMGIALSIFLANMIVLALCILIFSHVYEVSRERSETRLLQMAQTGFLTGLPSRFRINTFLEGEKSRALREHHPMALMVIDLDHFKRINDGIGHQTGDRALFYFADILQGRLRATDLAGHLGGEEFGVILVKHRQGPRMGSGGESVPGPRAGQLRAPAVGSAVGSKRRRRRVRTR